jgi:hypothetical protein
MTPRRRCSAANPIEQESLRTRDTWLAHYALARAYLELAAYPEAYSELQT